MSPQIPNLHRRGNAAEYRGCAACVTFWLEVFVVCCGVYETGGWPCGPGCAAGEPPIWEYAVKLPRVADVH